MRDKREEDKEGLIVMVGLSLDVVGLKTFWSVPTIAGLLDVGWVGGGGRGSGTGASPW